MPPNSLDPQDARQVLEIRWLKLTRDVLPSLARARRWPIGADHCFMRVFLDNACAGHWPDHIDKRPAYRHATADVLMRAIALAEAVVDDREDLEALNRRSLVWRGKAR